MFKNRFLKVTAAAVVCAAFISGCMSVAVDAPAEDTNAQTAEEVTEQTETDDKESSSDVTEEKKEEKEEFNLFKEMSYWTFHFCSGAGGWETYLEVNEDGTFQGSYHDSDMGDTGPGYQNGTIYMCNFSGKFGDWKRRDEYTYKLSIDEIDYENEVGSEEIEDAVRYIYTGVYGLEEVINDEADLMVYLPGRETEGLPGEYMEWISFLNFYSYLGSSFDYVQDIPEDLPFCGLFNTAGLGFYSGNSSDTNRTYIKNRVKLPDLANINLEMNDDGTYLCEDMDDYGMLKVTNACVNVDKYYDMYDEDSGAQEFVTACLDSLGIKPSDGVYVQETEYSDMVKDKMALSGQRCVYATFTEGSNEDARSCSGCFLPLSNSLEDGRHLALAYIVSDSENDSKYPGELPSFYLGSAELTGRAGEISSAGKAKGIDKSMFAMIGHSDDPDNLKAEEVYWVSPDDTELIEKFNLDPDGFYDDYQIAGFDGKFSEFPVDKDCIFYVQSPEDGYHKLMNRQEFEAYVTRHSNDATILANIITDAEGKAVIVFEPYTP
ncbi:MAG: hypothetical protein K6F87_00375 [Lachnospiraceae bacterium]|nr:hypothetical protein [Lachnospiraceae bacterium]